MAMVPDTDNVIIFPDTGGNSTTLPDMGGNSTIFPDTGGNSTVTLEDLNDEELQLMIPTIVFLVMVSVVGILGNSLVCNVYNKRSQCFIRCLSAIDLFSCIVTIPIKVTTFFSFKHLWLCNLSSFFNMLSTFSASFVLLLIAIDRYRKICRPFGWQINAHRAKILCGLSVIFALVFSYPALFVSDEQKREIPKYGLTGTKCFTDNSLYPKIHAAVLGGWLVVGTISGRIIYCLIGRQIQRAAKRCRKLAAHKAAHESAHGLQKVASMMILISIAFVVSYVPVVVLMIVLQTRDNFEETLTDRRCSSTTT